MIRALGDAVASSSAHGISRAAGSKATTLKVMWILLFLTCLVLFLKSGINLVMKLTDARLTKVYHLDQVQFEFPDLYLCPTNPYSGSYPFILTKSEADEVNSKISEIMRQYESLYGRRPFSDVFSRTLHVQTSLPFHLIVKYLTLRQEQSVLKASLINNYQPAEVQLETFYHPENLVCFKVILDKEAKQKILSKGSYLEIWLSTDPHYAEFNFTGHSINRIVDNKNKGVSFLAWHPIEIMEELKVSGYTMLIVPQGAYPSLRFENNFHLAPGNAYFVQLKMEENACSEDLHKTHCVANHPPVEFTNPLTNKPELFVYSYAACYYQRRNELLTRISSCQNSLFPMPWEFNSWPRCLNVSTLNSTIIKLVKSLTRQDKHDLEYGVSASCKNRIPCSYPHYSARYSFGNWPSTGSATYDYFANRPNYNQASTPALAKLQEMARQIKSGNYSSHTIDVFRSYMSESMVRVSISVGSIMSSKVMLTWSYTLTDFLADIGGLLGLYIGCSLLTVCELLELVIILVKQLFKKTQPTNTEQKTPDNDGSEATIKLKEEVPIPLNKVDMESQA